MPTAALSGLSVLVLDDEPLLRRHLVATLERMGADVTVYDRSIPRLRYLDDVFGGTFKNAYSSAANIAEAITQADMVIGAVLIPGAAAPKLVSRAQLMTIKPGSVLVDVAVDQGGCIESVRPTSHTEPVYLEEGVVHFGVPNMPGAVPWTATQALNNSTLPYVLKLANQGLGAFKADSALGLGLNTYNHELIHPAVRSMFPDLAAPLA